MEVATLQPYVAEAATLCVQVRCIKDGMEVATLQPYVAEAATLCVQVRCIKDGMEVATLSAGMFVGERSLI